MNLLLSFIAIALLGYTFSDINLFTKKNRTK
jgi:hypothetical protein